jgi:hypothetical protein
MYSEAEANWVAAVRQKALEHRAPTKRRPGEELYWRGYDTGHEDATHEATQWMLAELKAMGWFRRALFILGVKV